MLDRRRQLISLWREERKLRRELKKIIASLEARGLSDDEVWMEIGAETAALNELDERRRYIYHRRLIQRAERLSISPPQLTAKTRTASPPGDESWKLLTITRQWVLSPRAERSLRTEVREELKARRDYALGWITPFMGLIGVIVGYCLGRGK